jgi:TraM recognition site of TraD and TraG/Type IV secretory system Conjugative DNA transfer
VRRANTPRVPILAGNGAGVWVVLLIGWGLAAAAWLAWLAARIAAALAGRRMPSFSERWVISLARWRTSQAWPGTPTVLVALIAAVLACAVITAVAIALRIIAARIPRPGDPVAALAGNPQITPLTPVPAARAAIRLRPSLAGSNPRSLPAADTGLLLGDLKRPSGRGPALFASWEDTITAFMAPRSGKTTTLSIPYVLSAPGAVVATSNKADLWAATAQLRAGSGSTVWLFDPQRITGSRQCWWWNPLAGLATVEAAHRLAAHFVLTVDDNTRRDLWGPAAQDLLCALFLAAASSGRSLRECGRWLADAGSPIPAELLAAAGFGALAASLRGAQNGAPETRDGIYQTARTAAKCINDEDIMAWVAPPRGKNLPAFGPAALAAGRDTLYLLTESRSATSPLIAALTDTVMRAGRRQAERSGGRLDPPMAVILDEAANICRIADLPELYSHLGSRGMVPVTILQSYQQGVSVWGEPGMAALWGASTKKVIGAGIDDPRHARDLATLVGQHDVPVISVSYGDGRTSQQISLRRQEILDAADIRALAPGSALLLATGARPALISLRPWYSGPQAPQITAAIGRAAAAMQRAAQFDHAGARPAMPFGHREEFPS